MFEIFEIYIYKDEVVDKDVKYSMPETHQECKTGTSRSQERPELSPRLRAATHMRFAALGGFESSQARPQQAPLVGAALEMVLPSVAA